MTRPNNQRRRTAQAAAQLTFVRLVLKTSEGREVEVTSDDCLSVAEVASLKQVSRRAIYAAIFEGRLASAKVSGHTIIPRTAASLWIPVESEERAGAKRRGGRPRGSKMTEESKARIARTQRLRWADRKRAQSDEVKPPQEDETTAVESQRMSRRRRHPG